MYVPKLIVCLREGYSWKQFFNDLGAGIVVGLVALPLAIAFAIASGVPPERGLYTAIVAGFLISALGGSRVQIGGPTGAFVVIVAGIVATHGYQGLVLATLMAGVILIIMGLAQFGSMVKFIPYPVITGFTSGIAVIIFSSQIKDLLGLHMGAVPADFVTKWNAYLHNLSTVTPAALVIGLATVLLIAFWPKAWQKIPGSIVALVAASFAAALFHLPIDTIGSRFGGIPHGLPRPVFPVWNWTQIRALFPTATTIAMLAAIESLLSAVVADGMIGGRHKSNLELVAQGVANLASPLFGGIPATGAIARTATNIKNGGRTPIAGMIHAAVLLIILLTAGPLAARIPMAALAGILVVVSYHMSEWRSFRFLLQTPWSDIVVLMTTFLLTIFVDLTVAVEVGLVLAAFLFMRHMAEITHVKSLSRENGGKEEGPRLDKVPAGVEVFSVRGTFFFGATHKLLETLRIVGRAPKAFVLDMSELLLMDASGLHALQQMNNECRRHGTRLLISGIHAQPLMVLERADLVQVLGRNHLYGTLHEALQSLETDTPLTPAQLDMFEPHQPPHSHPTR